MKEESRTQFSQGHKNNHSRQGLWENAKITNKSLKGTRITTDPPSTSCQRIC
jgi:hypothetical protein